jgi:hypothetical protein
MNHELDIPVSDWTSELLPSSGDDLPSFPFPEKKLKFSSIIQLIFFQTGVKYEFFSLHFGNKKKIKGLPDSVARILPSEFPTLTCIPSVCSSDFPEKKKKS